VVNFKILKFGTFINTKKAFKKLYMFYFETFRNILNPSSVKKIKNKKKIFFEGFFSVDESVKSIPVVCSKVWQLGRKFPKSCKVYTNFSQTFLWPESAFHSLPFCPLFMNDSCLWVVSKASMKRGLLSFLGGLDVSLLANVMHHWSDSLRGNRCDQ